MWTIPELINLDVYKKDASLNTPPKLVKSINSNPKNKKIEKEYEPLEPLPPNVLRLKPEVKNAIDEFHFTCNAELDELTATVDPAELRFTVAEKNDFVAIQDPSKSKSLVYMNPTGWEVVVEQARVRPE